NRNEDKTYQSGGEPPHSKRLPGPRPDLLVVPPPRLRFGLRFRWGLRGVGGRGRVGRAGLGNPCHPAVIKTADEITQGGQRVVVLVQRCFVSAGGGIVVAVEAGFRQQVGATAFDDAQAAVLQTSGDRGDAGTQVVDSFADLEVGTAQLGTLV